MTLVVVLLLGAGFVLIISAIETDPTTGRSVSVTKTISDIWNDRVSFQQPAVSTANPGSSSSSSSGGTGQLPGTLPGGTLPGSTILPGGTFLGGSAPAANLTGDAYRRQLVTAYLQSQR